jgi:hypothetical protein
MRGQHGEGLLHRLSLRSALGMRQCRLGICGYDGRHHFVILSCLRGRSSLCRWESFRGKRFDGQLPGFGTWSRYSHESLQPPSCVGPQKYLYFSPGGKNLQSSPIWAVNDDMASYLRAAAKIGGISLLCQSGTAFGATCP